MEHTLDPQKRDEINKLINPLDLLRYIDYHFGKIQEERDAIRGFCPIHNEVNIRTLKIDCNDKSFKCSFRACPGNKGGDLITLLCQSRNMSEIEAIGILSDSLNLEFDFSLVFPKEGEFFRIIEEKISQKAWEEVRTLVGSYRKTSSYEKIKNKLKLLKLVRDAKAEALVKQVFSDIWKELEKKKKYQDLIRLAEKCQEQLDTLEQFDVLCRYLDKEDNTKELVKWTRRKVNWIQRYETGNVKYFHGLEKLLILDPSSLEWEEELSLLDHYTNREKIPLKKVKRLAEILIDDAGKRKETDIVKNIQNLLINLGITSPTECLPQMQENLLEKPEQTFAELEELLNSLTSKEDIIQAARFLAKNVSYIVTRAPSSLVITGVHVLLEGGYFSTQEKRENFLKILQKRPESKALSEQDSVFVMERLMSVSSGREKIDLLFKLFKHFYSTDKLEKMQQTAIELFSLLTGSEGTEQLGKLWKKILQKSHSYKDFEWLHQKAIQHFPGPLKLSLLKTLYNKVPQKEDVLPLRKGILQKILMEYNEKSSTYFDEYLQLILSDKRYHTEPFPQENFFKYFSEYWQSSSIRKGFKEYFFLCEEDFRTDLSREIVVLLEKYEEIDNDDQFWLVQYLKSAHPGDEPFFYIEKASLLFQYQFDREIFVRALRELQAFTDSSHIARFVKIGFNYYINNDLWDEVKNLFRDYGHYLFLTFDELNEMLEKACKKKDASFFLRLWDKYFQAFEQDVHALSDDTLSYYLQNIHLPEVNSLFTWLGENNQTVLLRRILSLLVELDFFDLIREVLLVVPPLYLTGDLEEKYIKKLQDREDVQGILEYYRRKVDFLLEKELFKEARQYCEKIRLLTPDDLATLKMTAELEEKIGNMQQAQAKYEQMYRIYFDEGLYKDAYSVLKKMQELFPQEPNIMKKKIAVAEKLQDKGEVFRSYQDLGYYYEKNDQIDKARELYYELYQQERSLPLFILKKLFKYALLEKKPHDARCYLMEILPVLAEQTTPGNILKYIRPVLSLIPDDIELLIMYAEKLMALDKKREAYKVLKKAGEVALNEKKIDEAIAVYEKMLQLRPTSITFHTRLGKLYNKKNTPDQSLGHYYEAARLCYTRKRYADAVSLLKNALNDNPFDLESAEFLADIYIQVNRPNKALPLLNNIADHYEQENNYEKAFHYYFKAVKISPDHISYRQKVLQYADGNMSGQEIKHFFEETFTLLIKKKEIALLQEVHKQYYSLFGVNTQIWENLFSIYAEEQPGEQLRLVFNELLEKYESENDYTGIVRLSDRYLEQFPPFPGFFSIYLPALYKHSPEIFFRGLPEWSKKYAALKEFSTDFLESIITLLTIVPNDYLLAEKGIVLLCDLNKKDAAWKQFYKTLEYALKNNEISLFAKHEKNILYCLKDKLDSFSELVPLYIKEPAHYLQLGKDLVQDLVNRQDMGTALHMINLLLESFPDDIDLNTTLLQLFKLGNDEIGVYEQTMKLAEFYEEKQDYQQAYSLYENILNQSGNNELEDKMTALLVKQGMVSDAIKQLEGFAEKAVQKDDLTRAYQVLKKGIELNPDNTSIYKKLLTVKKQLQPDKQELASDYFELASLYKKAGAKEGVHTSLYEAVQYNPSHFKYWMVFFEFLQEQKEYVDIFRYLPQCISSLKKEGEIQSIFSFLEKVIDKVPLEVILSVLDVLPLESAKNFVPVMKGGFDTLEKIQQGMNYSIEEKKPFLFPFLFELLSDHLKKKDDIAKHENILQRYLEFSIRDGFMLEALEIYRMLLNIHTDSSEMLRDFLEIASQVGISEDEEITCKLQLATIYMNEEKTEKSFDIIESLYGMYPDSLEVLERYVDIYPMIGMEAEILEEYRKLARKYSEKDVQKAETYWLKVQQLLPGDDEAQKALSREKNI